MLKIYYLSLVLLLFASSVEAQHHLQFTIRDQINSEKLYLWSYYGHDQILIDSCVAEAEAGCIIDFSMERKPGMYRMGKKDRSGIDFLYNNENVFLSVNRFFWLDSVVVESSHENQLFFEYLRMKNSMEGRLELLAPLVQYYPDDDPFYLSVEKEYNSIEKEYTQYLGDLMINEKGKLVRVVVQFDQLPDIDPASLSMEARNYLMGHYFDGVDLTDTLALATPILPTKVIDYLSLYVVPGGSKETQEALFIDAVDSVMKFTSASDQVQEVVINYLIEGFQMYGLEDVITHLVENYVVENSCVSDQKQDELQRRIEGFKKMAIGNQVPDIIVPDRDGNQVQLSKIGSPYSLVFFWASWCPHCSEAIHHLQSIYSEFGDEVSILGISVDSERDAWIEALDEKDLPWENAAELQGWNGKAVDSFYVYATPMFYLLDADLKIVAKPGSVHELEEAMNKLRKN